MWRLLALLTIGAVHAGCAAAALPVGLAALGGGATGLARAGTEYSLSGDAYRTFSAPIEDVRTAVLEALREAEVKVGDEAADEGGIVIAGAAYRRTIVARLEPVTPALTRLRFSVRRGLLGRDPATAAELTAQTARMLNGSPSVSSASR